MNTDNLQVDEKRAFAIKTSKGFSPLARLRVYAQLYPWVPGAPVSAWGSMGAWVFVWLVSHTQHLVSLARSTELVSDSSIQILVYVRIFTPLCAATARIHP